VLPLRRLLELVLRLVPLQLCLELILGKRLLGVAPVSPSGPVPEGARDPGLAVLDRGIRMGAHAANPVSRSARSRDNSLFSGEPLSYVDPVTIDFPALKRRLRSRQFSFSGSAPRRPQARA